MSNNLLYITNQYPYGKGEAFLETEIEYLCDYFDEVFILPIEDNSDEQSRNTPKNSIIIRDCNIDSKDLTLMKKIKLIIKMIPPMINDLLNRSYEGRLTKSGINRMLYLSVRGGLITDSITKILRNNEISIVYSFWSNHGAAAAINAIEKSKKRIPFICRSHGYDLFWERQDPPFVPFQKYVIIGSNGYHPDSKNGEKYLIDRYPKLKDKISTRYLGVQSRGISSPSNDDVFRIISCSNIIPLKRVEMIPKSLSYLNGKIKWTHFGDGPTKTIVESEIKNMEKKNSNIESDLRGHIPNKEFLDYYLNDKVDIFVHLSEYEGLPVSIMESMSFGVPVVAADSGGIRELVGERTGSGVLLDHNPGPIEVSNAIDYYRKMESNEFLQERQKARKIWEKLVDADKNFNNFAKELIGHSEK